MKRHHLRARQLDAFAAQLCADEKSPLTVQKYARDVRAFLLYCRGPVTRQSVLQYKNDLLRSGVYTVGSINSMLSSLNSFFRFMDWEDCLVKCIRSQRQIYCSPDKELTLQEYRRLLAAAGERLQLVLETICSTGIRVSELQYFTVEAVRSDRVTVICKGKVRAILIPKKMKGLLLRYAEAHGIRSGVIFRTRSGKPLDRSNIWSAMKGLCPRARVEPGKVFPHNLRKLFARTFYQAKKDLARLADTLGHSSVDTTRLYIMTSGAEHRQCVEQLRLLI